MVTCECGRCRLKFQVREEKAGTTQACPECGQPVEVGGTPKRKMPTWITVTLVILIVLVAISWSNLKMVGSKSTVFGSVGPPYKNRTASPQPGD
jgi:uncharacterized paraquat-inducible protein A